MKKTRIFLLLLLAIVTTAIQSQNISGNCYRGFADAGYTIGVGDYNLGRFEINSSHGYQINPHFFIGAGLGFHFMSEYETNNKDIALDIRESSVEIPIFANIKCNFTKSKVTPFIDIKAGTYITNNSGLYANISGGCRISTNEKQAVNVSIGYTMQNLEFETFNRFYGSNSMSYSRKPRNLDTEGISIKIGYEF